ncbi:MAG TPA: hypothetical protein VM865_00585 [Acidobacteriaceae bacterium]|jgi:hypothetical protein|nr:hypothetical protein [Acidobacteriaceae bacterium]
MSTLPSTPNPSPETKIGDLRKQYGPHFAAGYGDGDTLGEVLGRAGVPTLEAYLAQNPRPQA